ncbi:recombinase family protein [Kutzneria sp. CA-103260]|uniref:recombinase family protein n=1 Tax=Kutzneria sp. CA-103260 TaxID=2802641 RepID=UPI0020114D9F|nr:recombinase family protein [Kutzneria sp. CA-103260]
MVVGRIFAEYLDDRSLQGDRAIAAGLNPDGVPCPSAHRPEQNQHRPGDGWQAGTVRAILENPRYTGYAFFGRWATYEALLDPDDVAADFVVRFRRSTPGRLVRSRVPAHPAIIDVADFTLVQLRRRSRATGDGRGRGATERAGRTTQRRYLFRGRLRCALCGRKMPASPRGERIYYGAICGPSHLTPTHAPAIPAR